MCTASPHRPPAAKKEEVEAYCRASERRRMKRNTRSRHSKTRRRNNRRFSRKRATRAARARAHKQRGGFYGQRPQPYATDTYWVAGEEEAPRVMTAEDIEQKRTEDDKGV